MEYEVNAEPALPNDLTYQVQAIEKRPETEEGQLSGTPSKPLPLFLGATDCALSSPQNDSHAPDLLCGPLLPPLPL